MTDRTSQLNQFHEYLDRSFAHHEKFLQNHNLSWSPLKSLYIGGGTPSLWGDEGVSYLADLIQNKINGLDPECEFTMEVNPGTLDQFNYEKWTGIGVNRFSVGIQTLDANCFPYLDRFHSLDDSIAALEFFANKKANFSADLMLGLPKSSKRNVLCEIEKILNYKVSHLSVYILTVAKNYKYYELLPSEDEVREEFLMVSEFLKSKGFAHYEVSNFAKVNLESQHNLRYWNSSSVAALGKSATGFINLKKEGVRYKWQPSGEDFSLEHLNHEQLMLEKLYLGLRTNRGLDLSDFVTPEKKEHLLELINGWKERDLLDSAEKYKVSLNSKGYIILESLINDFFSLG